MSGSLNSPITPQTALLWAIGQGRAHGAELAARLRKCTKGAIVIPDGTLYPALHSLVGEQLAAELHAPGARRQFELTEAGQARLVETEAIIIALFRPRRRRRRAGKP